MNVTADNAVHFAFARELDQRFLVVSNVFHSALGFQLDVRRERPVAKTKHAPNAVDPDVQVEDSLVECRADLVEQSVEMRQPIELVSMDDQVTLAIGIDMKDAFDQPHRAKVQPEELLKEFVVIAGDENDPRMFAVLAEQFLDERVVLLGPEPFPA